MSLTTAEAQHLAAEALARHGGAGLRAQAGGTQTQLFLARAEDRAIMLKVWSAEAADRAARQARQQRQVAKAMRSGPFRVPGVLFFEPDLRVLAMPHIAGLDLGTLWQAGTAAVPEAAGGWLAAFHGLTRRACAFDPTGQVNWLARLAEAGQSGARTITDLPGFTAAAREVQAMAADVAGRDTVRAVTHRDMTLSNLLLGEDGTVWGIDLENRREDEPLRDLFTLALDLITLGADDGMAAVARLRAAHGETGTDPRVRLFLQRCFCLWVWANTLPAPSARHLRRLQVAERLRRAGDPAI